MPRRQPLRDDWPEQGDEQLLDVRLADLKLSIEGTLASRIEQLRTELEARGLRFPLHFYLSDEWFTPDGGTAIAIPFYLAHPRLERLEEAQMFEVEGGEHEWCMRILRHEAGHAIDHAFRLRRRRKRLDMFGPSSKPYPEFYKILFDRYYIDPKRALFIDDNIKNIEGGKALGLSTIHFQSPQQLKRELLEAGIITH